MRGKPLLEFGRDELGEPQGGIRDPSRGPEGSHQKLRCAALLVGRVDQRLRSCLRTRPLPSRDDSHAREERPFPDAPPESALESQFGLDHVMAEIVRQLGLVVGTAQLDYDAVIAESNRFQSGRPSCER